MPVDKNEPERDHFMPARRLFVMHQGALGDLVLTFPALRALKGVFRHVGLVCQEKLLDITRHLGLIDTGVASDAAVFGPLFEARFRQAGPALKRILDGHDTIVLFSNNVQLEKNVRHLYGNSVYRIPPRPAPDQSIHVSTYLVTRLTDIRILPKSERAGDPFLPVDPLAGRQRPSDPLTVLLHPGSGSERKNWPLAGFLSLYGALEAMGLQPEFILGPAEHALNTELAKRPGIRRSCISDLKKMLGRFARCGGFIGNDSGLTHLAAFAGLPTVAVFGPSDPARWRPLGPSVAIVSAGGDCPPCFETGRFDCDKKTCLEAVTPEMVIKAFLDRYRQMNRTFLPGKAACSG